MTSRRHTTDLAHILAKHQLGAILPGGVACMCGAELAALNPPFTDEAVKGEPLALAMHQMQELEGLTPQALDYVAEMSQLAQDNDILRAEAEALGVKIEAAWEWIARTEPRPELNGDLLRGLRAALSDGAVS